MEFTGKVALITGGGGGIGRASALGFAQRGAKVVVVDLDQAQGEGSAELVCQRGGDARFVHADVTKSGDVQNYVKATLEAYGAIDCFSIMPVSRAKSHPPRSTMRWFSMR